MKRLLFAATMAFASPVIAADVGVSITIGEPGFYGRIDIGGYPAPQLVYAQPMIIERGPAVGRPIYLHVPPGHAKRWRRYCHRYDACGVPVYFVQDRWYNDVYVPRYQERRNDKHRYRQDERRDDRPGRGHGRDRDRD